MRDALGVERQVTSSYYVSTRLLREGLSDFSLEAGAERMGYGVASFDYQYPFAAGAYSRGITNWLTVEARGTAGQQVRGGGIDAGGGLVADRGTRPRAGGIAR